MHALGLKLESIKMHDAHGTTQPFERLQLLQDGHASVAEYIVEGEKKIVPDIFCGRMVMCEL